MMTDDRKRVFFLTLIMVGVCVVSVGIALLIEYDSHFANIESRLVATVQSQARLIEAVARFNAQQSPDDSSGATEATLSQVLEAHKRFKSLGETGEFTLAGREDNQIVFQFRHRHSEVDIPDPIPIDSELAEPMRQALLGNSGTVIGFDYRGEMVLAAHEPVKELNMGMVAKIDLVEVRAPFIRAAAITGVFSILIVMFSVWLFHRISNPMIEKLELHAKTLSQSEGKLRAFMDSATEGFLVY